MPRQRSSGWPKRRATAAALRRIGGPRRPEAAALPRGRPPGCGEAARGCVARSFRGPALVVAHLHPMLHRHKTYCEAVLVRFRAWEAGLNCAANMSNSKRVAAIHFDFDSLFYLPHLEEALFDHESRRSGLRLPASRTRSKQMAALCIRAQTKNEQRLFWLLHYEK